MNKHTNTGSKNMTITTQNLEALAARLDPTDPEFHIYDHAVDVLLDAHEASHPGYPYPSILQDDSKALAETYLDLLVYLASLEG